MDTHFTSMQMALGTLPGQQQLMPSAPGAHILRRAQEIGVKAEYSLAEYMALNVDGDVDAWADGDTRAFIRAFISPVQ